VPPLTGYASGAQLALHPRDIGLAAVGSGERWQVEPACSGRISRTKPQQSQPLRSRPRSTKGMPT
jgi:hypothetical protein